MSSSALKDRMAAVAADMETVLDALIPSAPSGSDEGREARVFDAMRYATLEGGKRLRPFLVVTTAELFGIAEAQSLRTAAAIEYVHCYSLVHDDLPAMDDDDLRRGRPTTHKQFDEATAILAGDALLTLAFEVLADPATHADPAVRAELVTALSRGAGAEGMVGGQMFDLEAEKHGDEFDLEDVMRLQAMKTGRLIGFSCAAGGILGRATRDQRAALDKYSADLGLAFQIADDILDATGDEAEVGKKVGKDADAGKATFVSLLGLEEARQRATKLALQAASHLDLYGEDADLLREVAQFVVERRA